MPLTIKVFEHVYRRKATEFSVWVMEGEKHIFCAHPVTDPDTADMIAQAMESYLKEHGERRIREIGEE